MDKKNIFFMAVMCVLLWLAAGCAPETGEPAAVAPSIDSGQAVAAPAEVITVREAVLDFLREGANECVPPAGAVWQTSSGGAQTPPGYALYRFTTSDDCTVTVSYLLASEPEPVYHVALGHGVTGFCWQALVDGRGHVLKTGVAANNDAQLGNPAAVYCEAQGHVFEAITKPNGMQCGVCVFDDGSRCDGWAYLHNKCGPGDQPAGNGNGS